jgi:hypothetical protein
VSTRKPGATDVDRLVARYEPATQTLISASRRALAAAFPKASETADLEARVIGYGYGPGYKGTVATLILSKSAVKIGIPYGASLPDSAGLLAGAGKVHRHVAISSPEELDRPALKALFEAALAAWKARQRD